jgi:hypothetical protein
MKRLKVSKAVIVRAHSGVFFGYLVARSATELRLERVRHIWQWSSTGLPRKALTVEDVATIGAGSGTRISGVTAVVTISDWKVVADATPEAVQRIEALP